MKKIMYGVPPVALCFNVEKKAVQRVFKQCPHENASKNHQSYFRKSMAHPYRHGDRIEHDWQPYDRNCPPHCAGQELPKFTFKKSRAFLANNRLVNPLLVCFSKMANLEYEGFIQINFEVLRNHLVTYNTALKKRGSDPMEENNRIRIP